MLGCYRYIELNPVRAGIVAHPGEYRWSSYRTNAQGELAEWLVAQALYLALDFDAIPGNSGDTYLILRAKLFSSYVDVVLHPS